MAEELNREVLHEQNAEQAAQIALLITQNKVLIEENARLKKRIEQLERQVKRYVAPHSRETRKADRFQARVLKLREEGCSYRQIARDLGLSKNTVMEIIHRHR